MTRMEKDRYPNILMHGYGTHMDDDLESDQGKDGWTPLQKVVKSVLRDDDLGGDQGKDGWTPLQKVVKS